MLGQQRQNLDKKSAHQHWCQDKERLQLTFDHWLTGLTETNFLIDHWLTIIKTKKGFNWLLTVNWLTIDKLTIHRLTRLRLTFWLTIDWLTDYYLLTTKGIPGWLNLKPFQKLVSGLRYCSLQLLLFLALLRLFLNLTSYGQYLPNQGYLA